MIYIISVLAGFAYGCLFCWFNHQVLMKAVNKVDPAENGQKAATEVMKAYVLRYVVSLLALVLVIFICKLLPLHFLTTIIAAAFGLTIPSQIWHIRHDKNTGSLWHNSADSDKKWNDKGSEEEAEAVKNANEGWQAWEDWDQWDDRKRQKSGSAADALSSPPENDGKKE